MEPGFLESPVRGQGHQKEGLMLGKQRTKVHAVWVGTYRTGQILVSSPSALCPWGVRTEAIYSNTGYRIYSTLT